MKETSSAPEQLLVGALKSKFSEILFKPLKNDYGEINF